MSTASIRLDQDLIDKATIMAKALNPAETDRTLGKNRRNDGR
jgi:predicted transcriptional regulator